MRIVVDKKDTKVYYDENEDEYIKIFILKMMDKIGCFLRLKEYPGINFFKFSEILNGLGIKTIRIKSYEKYKVVTENLHGESLDKFLNNKELMKKYFNIIKTLYDNKIYSGDLALDNFMVKDREIYALDLEGYRHMDKKKRSPEEFERRFRELMKRYNIEI